MEREIKLVAHRFGKGIGLENTEEALKGAIKKKYYGVECDVQESKDRVLVVYHDLNLKRLTGIDKNIIDCDINYLKTLILTKKETNGVTYQGKILLFSDFLKIIKDSSVCAFIELKETCTIETTIKLLKELDKAGIPDNQYKIIANSCSIDLLVNIKKTKPAIDLMFVGRTNYQMYIQTCLDNYINLDISYTVFDENYKEAIKYVEMFKKKGLKINVWVVNKVSELDKYCHLGIDFITTDSITPQDINK